VPSKTPAPLFDVPNALHNLAVTVFAQGGQARARRNAWLAICSNQERAWERAEAQRAFDLPGNVAREISRDLTRDRTREVR
jgi:hypothetical protein